MFRKLAITALLGLAAGLPAAAAEVYTIDKSHSEASFQVRHIVTNTRGRFDDFSGTIRMDAAKPESSSVEFTIDAASIDTANADRDKHLKAEDFFWVEKHPEITFKSKSVKKTGESTYAVTGTLTMRGVAREVTLPVTYLGEAKDPWGNVKAGFETSTVLNRKDYGIVWNAALDNGGVVLSDEVKVDINIEALKQKPAAAGK